MFEVKKFLIHPLLVPRPEAKKTLPSSASPPFRHSYRCKMAKPPGSEVHRAEYCLLRCGHASPRATADARGAGLQVLVDQLRDETGGREVARACFFFRF